jgi:two-component system, chemotaxis family, chemotaxis protein CheY
VEEKLNFSQITALVVDGDRYSTGIVSQILRGFGLNRHFITPTGADGKKLLGADKFDLMITECVLPDMNAAELVRWVRRHASLRIRYMPIVMLTGYAHISNIMTARDSGVNSVVRKPVAPSTLFDHIAWSARMERPFIEADGYAGPCRRFKFGEPAPGLNRRSTDHESGETETNLEKTEETVT